MNKGQNINITDEQMAGAIGAGIKFLNLETTMIPGNMKKQLSVLEVVLQGIGQGALVVASPDQLTVKSAPDAGDSASSDALSGDGDAEGREDTGSEEG